MDILPTFPDHCRTWVYQAPRSLSETEMAFISKSLSDFVQGWAAHGAKLNAGFSILYDRFILIVVDENEQDATGCSIDDSVAIIRNISNHINLDLLDRMQVSYKKDNAVLSVPMGQFATLVESGEVTENTLVFNNMLTQLGEIRKNWEVKAIDCWHARYFNTQKA